MRTRDKQRKAGPPSGEPYERQERRAGAARRGGRPYEEQTYSAKAFGAGRCLGAFGARYQTCEMSTRPTDAKLLQSFDQIERGENAAIIVDAGLSVGRHAHQADHIHASGIVRHELPHQRLLPGF